MNLRYCQDLFRLKILINKITKPDLSAKPIRAGSAWAYSCSITAISVVTVITVTPIPTVSRKLNQALIAIIENRTRWFDSSKRWFFKFWWLFFRRARIVTPPVIDSLNLFWLFINVKVLQNVWISAVFLNVCRFSNYLQILLIWSDFIQSCRFWKFVQFYTEVLTLIDLVKDWAQLITNRN